MKRRTEGQWRELFAAYHESGLKASAFCRKQEVCPKYFSLRRRQLGDRPPGREAVKKAAFAPVRVGPVSAGIEVTVGERLRIRVPVGVSPGWLAELARGLL